jgi:GNAT superfamily N-acetyltransferase
VTAVRTATVADAEAVASCLGAAFAADPVWTWAVGDRAGAVVTVLVRLGALADPEHFTVNEGATSTAWWHPPGQWKMSPRDLLRLVPAVAPLARLGSVRLLQLSALIERQHPHEPHWYLGYLGTRAEARGRGEGAEVLAPQLARCDAEGLPAYLESSNPRNLPFYRRQGFVDRPVLKVPRGCPTITPMWRSPQQPR